MQLWQACPTAAQIMCPRARMRDLKNLSLHTWASIQQSSAGLSDRHSRPRGPLRQLLKATGMSSASGRYETSRTKLPSLHRCHMHQFCAKPSYDEQRRAADPLVNCG